MRMNAINILFTFNCLAGRFARMVWQLMKLQNSFTATILQNKICLLTVGLEKQWKLLFIYLGYLFLFFFFFARKKTPNGKRGLKSCREEIISFKDIVEVFKFFV